MPHDPPVPYGRTTFVLTHECPTDPHLWHRHGPDGSWWTAPAHSLPEQAAPQPLGPEWREAGYVDAE